MFYGLGSRSKVYQYCDDLPSKRFIFFFLFICIFIFFLVFLHFYLFFGFSAFLSSFFCFSAFLSFFWFFCIFVSLLWNKFQKVPSVQVYPVGFNRCPVYSLRKVWSHWAFLLHKKCGQGHSNHFARACFCRIKDEAKASGVVRFQFILVKSECERSPPDIFVNKKSC